MRSGEGDGHCFQAGDFEQQGLALCAVCIAADGVDGALEEGFARGGGHLAFKGAEARSFGYEHVLGCFEAGGFAGEGGFSDELGAGEEVLPGGGDGGEAGEERHY